MPKTHSPGDLKGTKNPYITTSINKSFLTPCRQMGLSRKRKTPSSLTRTVSTSSSSFELTPPCQEKLPENPTVDESSQKENYMRSNKTVSKCLLPSIDKSSPVKKKTKKEPPKETITKTASKAPKVDETNDWESTKKTTSKAEVVVESPKKKEKKTSLKKDKKKSSKKLTHCKEETDSPKHKLQTLQETDLKSPKKLKPKEETINHKVTKSPQISLNTNTKSPVKKIESQDKQPRQSKSPISQEIITIDDSPTKQSPKPKEKNKNWRRTLSLKTTFSDDEEDSPEMKKTKLKSCTVQLQKCDDDDPKDLAKELEEREKILQDLKQAEIYQKQHNVQELTELSDLWKKGCIQALNDLLALVKTRVDTDMAMLLKKINIPDNLLTLTPDGELI